MPSKTTKSGEKTEDCSTSSVSHVSKDDRLTALAKHKTTLLAEFTTAFNRIDGTLEVIQRGQDSHDPT